MLDMCKSALGLACCHAWALCFGTSDLMISVYRLAGEAVEHSVKYSQRQILSTSSWFFFLVLCSLPIDMFLHPMTPFTTMSSSLLQQWQFNLL